MLADHVQVEILEEEFAKAQPCECCECRPSKNIYLLKQGFCTVLSHVCNQCKSDLEADCIRENFEYQFLTK